MGFGLKKLAKKAGKVAGGLTGGLLGYGGADASKKASRAQIEQLKLAIGDINDAYGEQQNYLNPFREGGLGAFNAYQQALGLGPEGAGTPDFSVITDNPAYQFAQQQGEAALQRQAAAGGNLFGGNRLREAARFNTGNATQYMDNYLNRLAGLSDMGLGTSNRLADYAGQRGGNIANLRTGIGQARAGGYINAANSYSNAAANLLNFGTSLASGGLSGGSATGNNTPVPNYGPAPQSGYNGLFGSY